MKRPGARLKPRYRPLHSLSIDDRGFIRLGQVKICRYVAPGVLEFQDRSGGRGQGKRLIEITPTRLAAELIRLSEAVDKEPPLRIISTK